MVSICVPVYRDHGEPNLRTLVETVPAALESLEGEVVVALNGVPASVAPEGCRTVDLGVNRGTAAGWNAAAAAARGDILVFTNDDVVPGKGSVARLAAAARDDAQAGVFGVRPLHVGIEPVECEAVEGSLFAVRREVFEEVGGFDESFSPCLWEEADLCFAVRRRLGLASVVVPGVAMTHRPGISARRSWPWARVAYNGRSESLWSIRRRNRRRLIAKWA